ncbi:hypothetical protein OG474_06305 [Kribbella sp. NBC_01505]|uniref:hypothetical protein n=1 Tax=Kribbella sp. NBC_01505 TaxID=2903580 RepID=UPI00386C9E7A
MARASRGIALHRGRGRLADAQSEIMGMLSEDGAEQMRDGSIEHTLDPSKPYRYTAEVTDLWGETVLIIRIIPVASEESPTSARC